MSIRSKSLASALTVAIGASLLMGAVPANAAPAATHAASVHVSAPSAVRTQVRSVDSNFVIGIRIAGFTKLYASKSKVFKAYSGKLWAGKISNSKFVPAYYMSIGRMTASGATSIVKQWGGKVTTLPTAPRY